MNTFAVQPKEGAGMERAVPHWPAPVSVVTPLRPCCLGVVGLGDGGVQLVGARGVLPSNL